jgi:hypothetical protein
VVDNRTLSVKEHFGEIQVMDRLRRIPGLNSMVRVILERRLRALISLSKRGLGERKKCYKCVFNIFFSHFNSK